MADKKEFLKHTFIFGVGGTLAQFAPLILFPFYTNYLTPGDYGVLDVINQASDIINITLMIGGVQIAAMTFYKQSKDDEDRRKIAVTLTLFLWGMIAAAVAAAIVFADDFDMFLKTNNPKLLAFGLSVALCETLVGVPMTLMQARLESIRYVLVSWSMMFIRVGCCILFLAVFHWGIWGIYAASLIVSAVFSIALTARELMLGSLIPDFRKWKEIVAFALPFVPTGFLLFIRSNAGRYFLINYGPYTEQAESFAAIGLLAMTGRLLGMAAPFGFSPLSKVWTATMYDVYKQEDAAEVFGHFALRMLAVHSLWLLGVCVFAPEAIRGICSPEYYGAVVLIPIMAISSLLTVWTWNAEQTFYIVRKTQWKPVIELIALPLIFIFLYFFIPYGAVGVCFASLAVGVITMLMRHFITQHFFKIRYPFSSVALLFGICALCYGLSLLCGNAVGLGELSQEGLSKFSKWNRFVFLFYHINWLIFAAKAGIIVLWCVSVWYSGILNADDKRLAVQSVRKTIRKVSQKFALR